LRNASKYSLEKSPERRATTPNAVTQAFDKPDLSRVVYKPTYERLSSQQNDYKESVSQSGYNRFSPANNRVEEVFAAKTDFTPPIASSKDQFLKQRPNSGHTREPLYQTQNNLQSSKFDNMINSSEGFSSKYARDIP